MRSPTKTLLRWIMPLAQLLTSVATLAALFFLASQIGENKKTNKLDATSLLYQTEKDLAKDEASDKRQNLSTIWTLVPSDVTGSEFGATLLRLVTDDPTALKATSPEELDHSMYDAATLADEDHRKATQELRKLFLFTQNNFYHVHNVFDA